MKPPQTAATDLLRLLWAQPLAAVPFALFFSVLFGRFPESLGLAYAISLIFAATVGLAVWATRWFALRNHAGLVGWRKPALFYGVAAMGGSILGAFLVQWFLLPGFLTGSGRNLAVVLMFTLLFCALFMGLSLARGFYRAAMEKVRADQELLLARRIQRSFLVADFPPRPRLEIHAVNLPSRQVSGDFYDVVPIAGEGTLFALADVSGKGIPAALLSSMLQASLRTQADAGRSVAAILARLNTLVCSRPETGQFATFFLAWVDEETRRLRYTNAGHNHPVLLRDGGRHLLDVGGTVVGMMDPLTWEEAELDLRSGDRLLLYTDGVTEAASPAGEMFGEERLYALLDSLAPDISAAGMVDRVIAELREFLAGAEAGDDITILALRVRESATP